MGNIDFYFTIYDNYIHKNNMGTGNCKDMFENRADYPQYARNALPILIDLAKKGGPPIGYHELGDMLGISRTNYPRRQQYIGNCILACISTTLYKWEQITGVKLPRLTNIVSGPCSLANKNNYVRIGLEKQLGREPSWSDYESNLLPVIYNYQEWDEVLDTVELVDKERQHDV